MCFKKLARVAVGAGVGFLTGGPLGAVVGGASSAAVKGKSILGGVALGLAGGVVSGGVAAATGRVGGGLAGVTGSIGKLASSTVGKAVIGSAAVAFGSPQGAVSEGTTAGLIAGPTPVGAPVSVSGFAEGGIMTAPVAETDEREGVNIAIRMAQSINESFNRALST